MEAAFDPVAAAYDGQFTDTPVGRLQREAVRDCLEPFLLEKSAPDVLELNCGTGADARWMRSLGARVLATDLSAGMVAVARSLADAGDEGLAFEAGDLREFVRDSQGEFDLVFSNFGGLNCIDGDDLAAFGNHLRARLRPGGLFVAVVMPRVCLWESLYFLAKGRWAAAARRWGGGPVEAPLGGGSFQRTWYFSPGEFVGKMGPGWRLERLQAIGFFVPPSYLDPFFRGRPRLLSALADLDRSSAELSARAAWADHFLVVLRRGDGEERAGAAPK